jgi:hypothetical protein
MCQVYVDRLVKTFFLKNYSVIIIIIIVVVAFIFHPNNLQTRQKVGFFAQVHARSAFLQAMGESGAAQVQLYHTICQFFGFMYSSSYPGSARILICLSIPPNGRANQERATG